MGVVNLRSKFALVRGLDWYGKVVVLSASKIVCKTSVFVTCVGEKIILKNNANNNLLHSILRAGVIIN